jgi:hypothetical protein
MGPRVGIIGSCEPTDEFFARRSKPLVAQGEPKHACTQTRKPASLAIPSKDRGLPPSVDGKIHLFLHQTIAPDGDLVCQDGKIIPKSCQAIKIPNIHLLLLKYDMPSTLTDLRQKTVRLANNSHSAYSICRSSAARSAAAAGSMMMARKSLLIYSRKTYPAEARAGK